MRLVSWAGATAMSVAAVAGFVAGSAMHHNDPVEVRLCGGAGELCEAPPAPLSTPLPLPVEDIDLTCPTTLIAASNPQSPEPPLADTLGGRIVPVRYELPAGKPIDSELLPMPYLTDEPSPPLLPPLGDVPPLQPGAIKDLEPDNPVHQMAKQIASGEGADNPDPHKRMNELLNQSEQERQIGEDWRRVWMNDQSSPRGVTDKVPVGKPPVSEHPSSTTPAAPANPPKANKPSEDRVPQRLAPLPDGETPPSKVDTMEIRPGELPPKKASSF
jgi:hypothetical protein